MLVFIIEFLLLQNPTVFPLKKSTKSSVLVAYVRTEINNFLLLSSFFGVA